MSWQTDVLTALEAGHADANIQALTLWAESEATPTEWNNPLATTLDGYGGTDANTAGVKQYPTEADGVAATVSTLKEGPYRSVVTTFRAQASLADIFAAVNSSPWCPGCQGGHYPVKLWEAVAATAHSASTEAAPAEGAVDIADAVARKDGGVYVLSTEGGVFTFHGAPFFGSYPGLPEADRQGQRSPFKSIVLDADEAGYTITDQTGESYHFPAA